MLIFCGKTQKSTNAAEPDLIRLFTHCEIVDNSLDFIIRIRLLSLPLKIYCSVPCSLEIFAQPKAANISNKHKKNLFFGFSICLLQFIKSFFGMQ